MNEWEDLPKINIAFADTDKKWGFKGDVRRRDGTTGSKTKEEAKKGSRQNIKPDIFKNVRLVKTI